MTIDRERVARLHRWSLLAVALAALLAYGCAVLGDYVFDDVHSVIGNDALRDLSGIGRLLTDPSAFSGTGQRMYRPVLLVSFALNLAISAAPWSVKLGNVLLHVSVALLALGWLRRLGVPLLARTVAVAVFAVHPLATEAINLTSARSELLLVFGLVLGARSHLAWLRGRAARLGMLGMIAGAVIACGSKETGVVLPALLLAQAWIVRRAPWTRRDLWRAVRDVLPVIALVLGYLVLRKVLLGQATVSLLHRSGEDPTLGFSRTLTTQLATMGLLLPRGLLQMVVPVGLSFDPPVSFRSSFLDPLVLAGWLGVIAATSLALWPGRRSQPRRVGAMFAWLTALPWIVVPLNMPFAEHRLYGPLLGVTVAAAPLLAALLRRLASTTRAAVWTPLPIAALLLTFAALSTLRTLDYRDERLLWQHEIAQHPLAWRAWWGLGTAQQRYDQPLAAVEPLAHAHALLPQHFDLLRNYAEAVLRLPAGHEQPWRALVLTQELRERAPRDPWAHALSADACMQVGRASGDRDYFEQAEKFALACLDFAPPKALVYRLAANARRALGDLEGALAHLDACIAGGFDYVPVRAERATVLGLLGRTAEARRELRQLQSQAPFDPAVRQAMQQLASPGR
ncbi:MAG: hypothetical protein H6838_20580 [Planctomycetes bacterium]|nr:hypothetical protein [Planctomycetota bacterium]MCB9887888.1 hypothetical protein [Planctomycetota bacterium]